MSLATIDFKKAKKDGESKKGSSSSLSTIDFKKTSTQKKQALPTDTIEEPGTISKLASLGTGVATGLLPNTAAIAAFGPGFKAGMALPIPHPGVRVGAALVGGLTSSVLTAVGVETGQNLVLEKAAPETHKYVKEAQKQNPLSFHAGQLASALPTTGWGVQGLKKISEINFKGKPIGLPAAVGGTAAVGAGFETGSELASGEELSPAKIAMTAVAGLGMTGQSKFGDRMADMFGSPVTPSASPDVDVEVPPAPTGEKYDPARAKVEEWKQHLPKEPEASQTHQEGPQDVNTGEVIPKPPKAPVEAVNITDDEFPKLAGLTVKDLNTYGRIIEASPKEERIVLDLGEDNKLTVTGLFAKASGPLYDSLPATHPWKSRFNIRSAGSNFGDFFQVLKYGRENPTQLKVESPPEKYIADENPAFPKEKEAALSPQETPEFADDFDKEGYDILRTQGEEAAYKHAESTLRARGETPEYTLENIQNFVSKELKDHPATLDEASNVIEHSANAINADIRKTEIYAKSLEERLGLKEKMTDAEKIQYKALSDRVTRSLEGEKKYDKLLTQKEKKELLHGDSTKTRTVGRFEYPDKGLYGALEGLRKKLGKTFDAEGKAKLELKIKKLEYAIQKLERAGNEEPGIAVAKEVKQRLDEIGNRAKKAGLLYELRSNYVPHVLDWSKSKLSKEQKDNLLEAIQKKLNSAPKDSKIVRDFTQKRQYEFLRELEKMLKEVGGTDHGVVVHTDIARIVEAYEKAMQVAKIQKSMLDFLKTGKAADGNPWIMNDSPKAKELKYVFFEGKGSRALQNYRVHPELVDSMKFMFREKDPGILLRGLGSISHLTKAINVVGSLFHMKSLAEAAFLTDPKLFLKEVFTGFGGTRAALRAFTSDGDNKMIDLLIREGGLMIKVEDVQRTVIAETGRFLDETAEKAFAKLGSKAQDIRVLQRITDPFDKHVLQHLNSWTWDYAHTAQKIHFATYLFNKMKLKNPDLSDAHIAKQVSAYVNNTFGGLNWLQVANQVNNRFLKALAKQMAGIQGREWAQIIMFAPDWTVSTLRAVTTAFPKELSKPQNWKLREGIKGIRNPRTQGDLARRYVMHTALAWFTIMNAINMMVSDHPLWENKDPTRIDLGDGTSMQAAKHSMEAVHWATSPAQTAGNKLAFWPKALFVGITGNAYPSPTAPKLKDTSVLGRAKAIGQLGMPFAASSAIQAPEGEGLKRALLSTGGIPLYGRSKEQLSKAQKEGRAAAKEKRLRRKMGYKD